MYKISPSKAKLIGILFHGKPVKKQPCIHEKKFHRDKQCSHATFLAKTAQIIARSVNLCSPLSSHQLQGAAAPQMQEIQFHVSITEGKQVISDPGPLLVHWAELYLHMSKYRYFMLLPKPLFVWYVTWKKSIGQIMPLLWFCRNFISCNTLLFQR